jgi:hypothetical protein
VRQKEKIIIEKKLTRCCGKLSTQLLTIVFIELNKIIENTFKHLTICDCVDRFKDQSIIDV